MANVGLIFKIGNIVAGALLIALSILRFANAGKLRFVQILLTVYYVYDNIYIYYNCNCFYIGYLQ